MFRSHNSVIPTGTDHRKAFICGMQSLPCACPYCAIGRDHFGVDGIPTSRNRAKSKGREHSAVLVVPARSNSGAASDSSGHNQAACGANDLSGDPGGFV
jgi:hypothetical protein